MSLIRISFDAPPLGRVVKYFPAEEVDQAQDYIGKLQRKNIRPDVKRFTKEQLDEMSGACDEED